jgi:hypothetical protein
LDIGDGLYVAGWLDALDGWSDLGNTDRLGHDEFHGSGYGLE